MDNSDNAEHEGKKEDDEKEEKEKALFDSAPKQKSKVVLVVLALFIIFLFASYTVIFPNQNGFRLSKNMVFSQDPNIFDTYYGSVKDINENLSKVRLTLKDAGADATNATEVLEDGRVIETNGDFWCIFYDRNTNGMLDSNDEFVVHNVSSGDWIKIYLKSSDSELAFYQF